MMCEKIKHTNFIANLLLIVFITFPFSYVSSSDNAELNSESNATISWGRKYFFDEPRFKDNNLQELLDSAISNKLSTFGFDLGAQGAESKYVLNYTILLKETASNTEVNELLNQEPELRESINEEESFEHGKILVSIRMRDTNEAVWKNSIKGIAILDMPAEMREQRVNNLVDQVFETFSSSKDNL